MKLGSIYSLTNKVNGKCYIGKTVNWSKRMSNHRTEARTGSPARIHAAIRKYGWENFLIDQWCCGCPENWLNVIEIELIRQLRPAYNIYPGGEGTPSGESHPRFGKPPHNKGKHLPEEQKRKIAASAKGRVAWNKGLTLGRK